MDTIKTFRKRNKISQVTLAEYLDVTQGFISQMENGTSAIPDAIISKILDNTHGWDVSMLTADQPEDPAEEKPEDRSLVNSLLSLIDSQKTDIRTLLEMIKEKDEEIRQLREELDERKRGTAQDAAASSGADAV